MKISRIVFSVAAFLVFSAGFRGYDKKQNLEGVWMEVSYPAKNLNYYIDADTEGNVIMREVFPKKVVVRKGIIKKMFVKDFFREVKNSDIVNQQNFDESKILFYKGEVIKISAYINGELKRVSSPLNKFGDAFNYAFNELKKQVLAVKPVRNISGFITAVPLEGALNDDFRRKASQDYKLEIIEAKTLKTNPLIFKAVNQPYRYIPVETEDDLSEISNFIYENKLFGLKSLFYIGTTRGNYQCSVLDAK